MKLSQLVKEVHETNHRWWYNSDNSRIQTSPEEKLVMMHSEITEAMEGARKSLMDDHLPKYQMVEVELADTAIRALDYIGGFHLMPVLEDIDLHDNRPLEMMFHGVTWRNHDFGVPEELRHSMPAYFFYMHRDVTLARTNPQRIVQMLSLISCMAAVFHLRLDEPFREKLVYNGIRKDHTYEARAAEGGKKW